MNLGDFRRLTEQLADTTELGMSLDFSGEKLQIVTGHSVVIEHEGQFYGLSEVNEKGISITQCRVVFMLWPKEG